MLNKQDVKELRQNIDNADFLGTSLYDSYLKLNVYVKYNPKYDLLNNDKGIDILLKIDGSKTKEHNFHFVDDLPLYLLRPYKASLKDTYIYNFVNGSSHTYATCLEILNLVKKQENITKLKIENYPALKEIYNDLDRSNIPNITPYYYRTYIQHLLPEFSIHKGFIPYKQIKQENRYNLKRLRQDLK